MNLKSPRILRQFSGSNMVIEAVTATAYAEVVQRPLTVFHSAAFNELNAGTCEEVLYLLFRNNKYRFGLIGGIRQGIFYSPFSAPFGGFQLLGKDTRIQFLDEALAALTNYLQERRIIGLQLTLPPFRYSPTFLAKVANALVRHNYTIKYTDLNHHFELSKLEENYLQQIKHNARKHLRKAQGLGLQFTKAETEEEQKLAYGIIAHNRKVRGNPLHLTWERLKQTTNLVKADFFLLGLPGDYLAAAINFWIAPDVVQVIYWGSLPEKNDYRPMNLLAYKVFAYYASQYVKWVDLGQSSINSVPQQGLSAFKESMACDVSLKLTFENTL